MGRALLRMGREERKGRRKTIGRQSLTYQDPGWRRWKEGENEKHRRAKNHTYRRSWGRSRTWHTWSSQRADSYSLRARTLRWNTVLPSVRCCAPSPNHLYPPTHNPIASLCFRCRTRTLIILGVTQYSPKLSVCTSIFIDTSAGACYTSSFMDMLEGIFFGIALPASFSIVMLRLLVNRSSLFSSVRDRTVKWNKDNEFPGSLCQKFLCVLLYLAAIFSQLTLLVWSWCWGIESAKLGFLELCLFCAFTITLISGGPHPAMLLCYYFFSS